MRLITTTRFEPSFPSSSRHDIAGDGDDVEDDPVDADLDRCPMEHAGGECTAQHDQCVDAILIDHPADEEAGEMAFACASVRLAIA